MDSTKLMNRYLGRFHGGYSSHKKQAGIHKLSKEQQKFNAVKGGQRLARLMLNEEYRALHSMKIRYGRLKRRFNRVTFQEEDA